MMTIRDFAKSKYRLWREMGYDTEDIEVIALVLIALAVKEQVDDYPRPDEDGAL